MLANVAKIVGCALVAQRATLKSLVQTPDVPLAGQNVSLAIGYSFAGQPITGGKASYSASVNQVPLQTQTQDLCTQTKCPIESGDHVETSNFQVPSNFLGLLQSKIVWTDQNEQPVWCVQLNLNVNEPEDSGSSSSSSSGSGSSSSSSSGSGSSGSGSGSSGSSSGSGSSGSSGSSSSSSSSSGSGSSSNVTRSLRGF